MDGFPPFQDGDGVLPSVDMSNYSASMNTDHEQIFSSFISDVLPINNSIEQPYLELLAESRQSVQNHSTVEATDAFLSEILPNSIGIDDADMLVSLDPLANYSSINEVYDMPNSSYPLVKDSTDKINSSNSLVNYSSTPAVKDSVPRIIMSDFVVEKLYKALSLLKSSLVPGILVQVWMPFKNGDRCFLSTSDQPYLLDDILNEYREISRIYHFSGNEEASAVLGLPGRVFVSGIPEWTSNVHYYNPLEFLRRNHAIGHDVRGSLGLPIFNPGDDSCHAVLELVTKKEKPDFDREIQNVCTALQAVNLSCVKSQAYPLELESLKKRDIATLSEIFGLLRVACHVHMLPLALTWFPFSPVEGQEKMLHVHETASYVHDKRMGGFVGTCAAHPLLKGQGAAGVAIQSDHPVFFPDIQEFYVHQYPVVHHARKFGLHAAFAIRYRSPYAAADDDGYVLEFFLPTRCRGSEKQQLLLNNLTDTIVKTLGSLRRVSNTDTFAFDSSNWMDIDHIVGASSNGADPAKQTTPEPAPKQHQENESDELDKAPALDQTTLEQALEQLEKNKSDEQDKGVALDQTTSEQEKLQKIKGKAIALDQTTSEQEKLQKIKGKAIALDQITTLESAMKKHQKIKGKVIALDQTTLEQALKQLLKNKSDDLSKAVSFDQMDPSSSKPQRKTKKKKDKDISLVVLQRHFSGTMRNASKNLGLSPTTLKKICREYGVTKWPSRKINKVKNSFKKIQKVIDSVPEAAIGTIKYDQATGKLIADPSLSKLWELPASDKVAFPELATDNSTKNQNQDAGNCSCSKMAELLIDDTSSDPNANPTRVKVTYKEENVCFKYLPSMNLNSLSEEIARRFKLPIGSFQLKYKDDEDEIWVILDYESDLKECIEMAESAGLGRIRVLVQDLPNVIGSSSAGHNNLPK